MSIKKKNEQAQTEQPSQGGDAVRDSRPQPVTTALLATPRSEIWPDLKISRITYIMRSRSLDLCFALSMR